MTKKKAPARKRYKHAKKIVFLGLVILSGCFSLGYYTGVSWSPDYDSDESAWRFFVTNVRADEITGSNARLSLQAGFRTFRYELATDSLETILPPLDVIAKMKPPRRHVFKEHQKMTALIGIGAAAAPAGAVGVWQSTTRVANAVTAPQRAMLYVGGALVALGGGGLGWMAGYEDKADYNSEAFVKKLNDRSLWKGFASRLRSCRATMQAYRVLIENDPDSTKLSDQFRKQINECQTISSLIIEDG